MFLELIAVFVAGFAGAGVTMALTRLGRGALPRWLVPVGAGGAMLAAAIALEYSWFERTSGNLPEGLQVATTETSHAPWRPWTFVIPMTERFWAVDKANMLDNEAAPGIYLAQVYRYARWSKPQARAIMVDCNARRWGEPPASDAQAPAWQGGDDAIVATVCEEA